MVGNNLAREWVKILEGNGLFIIRFNLMGIRLHYHRV